MPMVSGRANEPIYGRRFRVHGGLHLAEALRTQVRVQRCSVRAREVSKVGPRFVHKTARDIKAKLAQENVQRQNKRFRQRVIKEWRSQDQRAKRARIPWVSASETLAGHVLSWEPLKDAASSGSYSVAEQSECLSGNGSGQWSS